MKHVLVTGGAGYVGCVLVPKLLQKGYAVTVYDILLFGDDGLRTPECANGKLRIVKGDIRDEAMFREAVTGCDAVIHMACIANDPSFELNPQLSKSINYDCFEPMVAASKAAGVKRFLYVSTSSVYGVSDAPEVTEDHPLVPITDYNKYKGLAEAFLPKYESPNFTTTTIRPATVCGYSPRMRLDLSVNILTNLAIHKRQITVFGGPQKRPNIHIEDVTDLYVALLDYPKEKIAGEVFNAGFQNRSIADLAALVKAVVEQEMPELGPIEIVTSPTDDIRSYHVSSEKIRRKLGWEPKRTLEGAVRDLCRAFKAGKIPNSIDDPRYYNVKQIKKLGFM